MTAVPDGFREVLVIESAAAGVNPAVRQVSLGLSAVNGQVAPKGRGFAVTGPSGVELLTGAAPVMWDSAGGRSRPGDSSVLPDRLVGPQDRDQVREVASTATSSRVTLVPDPELLDSSSTVYPVYVDPAVSASQYSRGMIDQANPSTASYNWSGDQGVGYQNYEGWNRRRLMFRFTTPSAAKNRQLISATMTGDMVWASQCNTKGVQAWKIGPFTSSSTWNNFTTTSSTGDWRKQLSTTATLSSSCFPRAYDFNVTSGVDLSSSYQYLGLKGSSETDPLGWRRFQSDVRLSITYNSVPSTPTSGDLTTTSPSTTCVSGSGRPVTNDTTPTLRAYLKDADTAVSIKGEFAVERRTVSGTTWSAVGTYTSAAKKPQDYFSPSSTLTFANNYVYRWRARALETTSGYTSGSYPSFWCELLVDTSKPSPPTVTQLTPEPVQVGQPVTFSVAIPPDAVSAKWSLNIDVPVTTVSASTWQFTVTPTSPGPNRVRVWSIDAATNPSPTPTMVEFVIDATAATNRWPLNEASGATAVNTWAGQDPLTTSSGFTRIEGPRSYTCTPEDAPDCVSVQDRALHITSGSPVIQGSNTQKVDTTASFTVMAKVRPAAGGTGGSQFVLQQPATSSTSAFALGALSVVVDPVSPELLQVKWDFVMRDDAGAAQRTSCVQSGIDPTAWVHLGGRYNAATHGLELLVDGGTPMCDGGIEPTEGAIPPAGRPLISTLGLQVGRAWFGATGNWPWAGDVDEVATMNGYLPDVVVANYRDVTPDNPDL